MNAFYFRDITNTIGTGDERVPHWILETNTLALEASALKHAFENQPCTCSQLLQTEHPSRRMLLTHTYSPPKMGGIALSYSCFSTYAITLDISTNYIYAIALPTGLNALQVDLANKD